MFKRFFKSKPMSNEELNKDVPQEDLGVQAPEGPQMPGVDAVTGNPVGTVNQPEGSSSQPAEGTAAPEAPAPATPEQPPVAPEVPVAPTEEANEETAPEATPAVDPMQPVSRS